MPFVKNRSVDRERFLLAISLLLSACSAPAYAGNPTATVDSATPAPVRPFTLIPIITLAPPPAITHTAAPTPAPTPTLAPTVTPTPVCTARSGTVVKERISAPTLRRTLWIRVYLPPCYETQTWRAYPRSEEHTSELQSPLNL